MIPVAVGAGIHLFSRTVSALSIGCAVGTGYSLGRKYGRKMCVYVDQAEERISAIWKEKVNQKEA